MIEQYLKILVVGVKGEEFACLNCLRANDAIYGDVEYLLEEFNCRYHTHVNRVDEHESGEWKVQIGATSLCPEVVVVDLCRFMSSKGFNVKVWV